MSSRRESPVVFAYDFPHKKTQDVILRLVALGQPPAVVIGAPPVPLGIPASPMRMKARHADLVDPSTLCRDLGIDYVVAAHNGDDILLHLDAYAHRLGIIAGARILPRALIERFPLGIINFHPGLLPETRGLDAMQWAIYHDRPLGVTAHLIDQHVDAGTLLQTCIIDEYPDDSFIDISLRLYETQLDMLGSAIERAVSGDRDAMPRVRGGRYHRSFPAELLPALKARFAARKRRLFGGADTRDAGGAVGAPVASEAPSVSSATARSVAPSVAASATHASTERATERATGAVVMPGAWLDPRYARNPLLLVGALGAALFTLSTVAGLVAAGLYLSWRGGR